MAKRDLSFSPDASRSPTSGSDCSDKPQLAEAAEVRSEEQVSESRSPAPIQEDLSRDVSNSLTDSSRESGKAKVRMLGQSESFEDFANLTRACTRNSHQRYNYAPTPQRLDMLLRERFKKSTCVTNSIEAVRLTPTSHLRTPTTSIYLLLNSCRLLEISVFSFLPSFSRSVPSSYPLTSCQCQTEEEKCKSTMVRKYR